MRLGSLSRSKELSSKNLEGVPLRNEQWVRRVIICQPHWFFSLRARTGIVIPIMANFILRIGTLIAVLVPLWGTTGCVDLNDPYSSRPSYDGGYHGGGYYDDDYHRRREWERTREQRHDLERERERLEDERRRLEREREQIHNRPPPPPAVERCPPGFSPSERKCSQDERRRGCKDIRLPGGLGCVNR